MAGSGVLSIGIAARNEQATIRQTLHSVEVALAEVPPTELGTPVATEVIVALNGCTDGTRDAVADYLAGYVGSTALRVIESAPGLVEAQRAIAEVAAATDYLILVDADCLLDRGCLRELVQAMADHPEAQTAWATMVPADHDRQPGFWRQVYNFADYHPDVIHRGRHLCGRAFAIRHYDIPRASEQQPAVDPRVAGHLSLERGPLNDDSYLSRALISRHGPDCIRHAVGARIYFQPIPRLRDFLLAQRRKVYEPRRLDLLFPEYRTLPGRHFGKRVDPTGYRALQPIQRLQCQLYRLLYAGLRQVARVQLWLGLTLVRLGVPLRPCEVWPVVAGTKVAFPVAEPADTQSAESAPIR